MISTERIPQREYSIHRFIHTTLMSFQIHTQITTVYVSEEIGLHTSMIKSGIEHRFLILIISINIYFCQIVIP